MSSNKTRTRTKRPKPSSPPKKSVDDPDSVFETIIYLNPKSPNVEFFKYYVREKGSFIIDDDYEYAKDSIIDSSKKQKLCKDIIWDQKIKTSLEKADFILAKAEMSVNSRGEVFTKIVGFITGILVNIQIKKKPSSKSSSPEKIENKLCIFVDVLCGHTDYKSVGKYLMTEVKQLGKDIGAKEIKLDSITESVGFYVKMGMECDPFCKMKWKI